MDHGLEDLDDEHELSPFFVGRIDLADEIVGESPQPVLVGCEYAIESGHYGSPVVSGWSDSTRSPGLTPRSGQEVRRRVRCSAAIRQRGETGARCDVVLQLCIMYAYKRRFGRVDMELEQVKEAVQQAAKDGVLTCHDARALAEELGVDYSLVGQACNEAGIKVRVCDLGCF